MKRILFLFITILTTRSWSQNYLVTYDGYGNDGEHMLADMIYNDTAAVFVVAKNDGTTWINDFNFEKRKKEGFSYSTERFMNVEFNVKDSLIDFKWQLLDDTMTILHHKCLAARTYFRGRSYLAYYAPDIPTSEGPWKFGGLPGHILLLKTEDGFANWKAVKIIENYTGPVPISDLSKYKFLKWNEFVVKFKATVDKYMKYARSSGTLPFGSDAVIKENSIEIFYPELQTGNGIKF